MTTGSGVAGGAGCVVVDAVELVGFAAEFFGAELVGVDAEALD
jgi:hypothetical protein